MLRALLATFVIALSIWVLESARSGVSVTHFAVGGTPVTAYAKDDATGPAVLVAHGFAGSSQMMQGYALPLAQSGYRVHVYDFLGHGRHRLPMSGDVTSVDGTTRLLVEQTTRVLDAIDGQGERIALLGHSMASDILVRVANQQDAAGPLVLLSAFSEEITPQAPNDLLLLVGAWEPGLREFAQEATQMIARNDGVSLRRHAVVLPMIEHVSILQSTKGQAEAIAWLNASYGRGEVPKLLPTGPAIIGVLAGLVVLFTALVRFLPPVEFHPAALSRKQCLLATVLPAIATPPLSIALNPGVMPVLIADYLALHLIIYGLIQLGLLRYWRIPLGPFAPAAFGALVAGCGVFAFALDRYAANFLPVGDRIWIIGAMAIGAVLFFVADARLSHRTRLRWRFVMHAAFLGSLIIAVLLDFEALFFLMMIAPVIVVFFAVFGTMGHAVSNRSGPLAPGLALGLMLAWSLGVTFPLFQG